MKYIVPMYDICKNKRNSENCGVFSDGICFLNVLQKLQIISNRKYI